MRVSLFGTSQKPTLCGDTWRVLGPVLSLFWTCFQEDSTSRASESKSYQSVSRILSLQFVPAVKGEINEKYQRKDSVSNIPNPLSFLKSARQICPDYSQIWFQNRLKTGPKTRHVSPQDPRFLRCRKSKPAPKSADWGSRFENRWGGSGPSNAKI